MENQDLPKTADSNHPMIMPNHIQERLGQSIVLNAALDDVFFARDVPEMGEAHYDPNQSAWPWHGNIYRYHF